MRISSYNSSKRSNAPPATDIRSGRAELMGQSKITETHETAVENGSGLHILDGLETACLRWVRITRDSRGFRPEDIRYYCAPIALGLDFEPRKSYDGENQLSGFYCASRVMTFGRDDRLVQISYSA
jgi:hypothetical protein